MPARGTYQIANREEGKQAQRDQSYKSCVLALLIFFFLCIILILGTFPWRKSYGARRSYDDEQSGAAEHHGSHEHETTNRIETTTETVTESTTEFPAYVTDKHYTKTGNRLFEKYSNNATTMESTVEPETTRSIVTLDSNNQTTIADREENNTVRTINENVDEFTTGRSSTTNDNFTNPSDGSSVTTERMVTRINIILHHGGVTESSTTESDTSSIEASSSTENYNASYNDNMSSTTKDSTTEIFTDSSTTANTQNDETRSSMITDSTSTEVTMKYQSVSDAYENDTMYDKTTEAFATSTTEEGETEVLIKNEEEVTIAYSTTELSMTENETDTTILNTESVFSTTETSTVANESLSTTVQSPMVTNEVLSTTEPPEKEICTTSECKQLASKMLFYMNHTIDPCEDFYEYACGGFEGSKETVEYDPESRAYDRIARQLLKERHQNVSSLFMKYYDSCVTYENVNKTERIRLVREELNKVGKFYTTLNWSKNATNITVLITNLLLHHSPILFDISPELDEYHPNQFILKIGPTVFKDPFDTNGENDPCYADELQREAEHVDLGKLYKEYKTCKKDTTKFVRSIADALTELGVFDELGNAYNISQYLQTTVIKIDFEIVQNYFANYPSQSKIREAYLMKNYSRITVQELDRNYKLVDWTQLIYLLTNRTILPEVKLQIYFHNELKEGLKSLEQFNANEPMELHNALLGLYARNLYHKFVLSKSRDIEKHCVQVAANLMLPEASSMYMSSFSKDELVHMNKTIQNIFKELTETLKLELSNVQWTEEEGRTMLMQKVNDLEVLVPDISYLKNNDSFYRKTNADKVNLSDNYFENSMMLMRRYRKLMYYDEQFYNPSDPQCIWTHYATPFQSRGLAIYGLNLVVIPYGVVDAFMEYNQTMFDNLLMATLGNSIAHQIAHHFDANGIYYWNGTRDIIYSMLYENDSASASFEEYINCQKDVLYEKPMNITLPNTGQTVSYQIPQLTLNERLSESMGLRLAHDTLDRLRSKKVDLPWLELGFDQLFYLAYAQMHCTKSPLTSSYISFYEDEQLPSRIRIFVAASNDELLGKAWNCSAGSRIVPSYTCSVFPHLSVKDTFVEST